MLAASNSKSVIWLAASSVYWTYPTLVTMWIFLPRYLLQPRHTYNEIYDEKARQVSIWDRSQFEAVSIWGILNLRQLCFWGSLNLRQLCFWGSLNLRQLCFWGSLNLRWSLADFLWTTALEEDCLRVCLTFHFIAWAVNSQWNDNDTFYSQAIRISFIALLRSLN